MDEIKEEIILTTLQIFNEKGSKLTMDDISKELSMSKKTLYKVFSNKEELIELMVTYCFDLIKVSKSEVLNQDIPLDEKIERYLSVMPSQLSDINFQRLYDLKDTYPHAYEKVKEGLESDWEGAYKLIDEGIKQDLLRPINKELFKSIYESALERFFKNDILLKQKMTYSEALNEVVLLLLNGARKREDNGS